MAEQSTAAAEPMPRRIQRSRAKGWRMPPNTVYVGRPTFWGNPLGGEHAADRYRRWIAGQIDAKEWLTHAQWRLVWHSWSQVARRAPIELRGKHLACWCRLDQPCHADVLLELANAPLRCEAAP